MVRQPHFHRLHGLADRVAGGVLIRDINLSLRPLQLELGGDREPKNGEAI
jgi:hypothetical protein